MAIEPVYLDANATAPLRPAAYEAMMEALAQTGNASSVHRSGRRAQAIIEEARVKVAALAGARTADVVFTASATEANFLALNGVETARRAVSAIEHPAVLENAPGATVIPCRQDGQVDCAALEAALRDAPGIGLVSVMAVNNETGVIQPVEQAAEIAHSHGALLHCDAVQAAGRIPLDLSSIGADLLTLSAHKIGGPQGAAALILAPGMAFESPLRGGGQERRRRAGTENVAAIAGFGAAAEAARQEDLPRVAERAALRDSLEARLREAFAALTVFGADAPRVWNTSLLALPGAPAEKQLIKLDLAGMAVSSGAACSSGKVAESHVLRAMGVPPELVACAIRISLGWHSTAADIDAFVDSYTRLYAER